MAKKSKQSNYRIKRTIELFGFVTVCAAQDMRQMDGWNERMGLRAAVNCVRELYIYIYIYINRWTSGECVDELGTQQQTNECLSICFSLH